MNPAGEVLVFATQHMPAGGIESHLQEFCRHLSRSGVALDLIITDSRMDPGTEKLFRRHCRRVYLGKLGKSSLRTLWLLGTGLLSWPRKYTAVYTNGQGESILPLKRLVRADRWIHHHHTSGDAADQATWGTGYRKVLGSADTVIACSRHNAGMMHTALGRNIDVIPCFSREIRPERRPAGPEGRIRFGYYGRLIPEKGIDLLCRLSTDPECRHLEFHIWGEGEAYPPAFFSRYPNVRYHRTFRGPAELGIVLGSIDGFLLLSRHPEGLPICLLEAMSAGIPWLATDRGGIRDIACDPLATRLISNEIPNGADYAAARAAVLAFADDIRSGRISPDRQVRRYRELFSAARITDRWRTCLGLNQPS